MIVLRFGELKSWWWWCEVVVWCRIVSVEDRLSVVFGFGVNGGVKWGEFDGLLFYYEWCVLVCIGNVIIWCLNLRLLVGIVEVNKISEEGKLRVD